MASNFTDRFDGAAPKRAIVNPCRVGTTANITLSGAQTIDTLAIVSGDRVLVKDQTDQKENGIYVANTGTWTRSFDFNGNGDVVKGTLIYVPEEGSNISRVYQLTTANTVTIGTDNITFEAAPIILTTSSFIDTFLTSANAAAGRTNLELGTIATENIAAISAPLVYNTDNTHDIGTTTKTIKDIYVGGGLYLGGTTSANFMDDFETGTWTPTFTSTSATFAYTTQVGEYTKIGKLVFLEFRLQLSGAPGGTTTNTTFISGLPFTAKTISNMFFGGHIGHYFGINLDANEQAGVAWQMGSSSTTAELKGLGDNAAEQSIIASQLSSTAQIRGTIMYISS